MSLSHDNGLFLKAEKVILNLPIFFLLAAFVEILVLGMGQLQFSFSIQYIVVNAIFLNLSHVLLTYLMLLRVPEMRAMISLHYGGRPWRFWGIQTGLFFALFAIFCLSIFKTDPLFSKIVLIATSVIPIHHVIFQIRGMSLMMNRNRTDLSETDQQQRTLSEWLEGKAVWLFFVSVLASRLVAYLSEQWTFTEAEVFFVASIPWVLFFSSAGLLAFSLSRIPRVFKLEKSLFMSRLFLIAMIPFSAIAGASIGVYHGLDYLCVFRRIIKNSNQSEGEAKRLILFAALSLVFYGLLISLNIWFLKKVESSNKGLYTLMALLLALTSALQFLHTHLDAFIFKMNDPNTKKLISPLLNRS